MQVASAAAAAGGGCSDVGGGGDVVGRDGGRQRSRQPWFPAMPPSFPALPPNFFALPPGHLERDHGIHGETPQARASWRIQHSSLSLCFCTNIHMLYTYVNMLGSEISV